MRQRALIHVAGPASAGKTTFIERFLGAGFGSTICVRGRRDPTVRRARESAPAKDKELRRYREAGATGVAVYRFAAPDPEAFYSSDVLLDFSEAILVEGDCPTTGVNLTVFVGPPPRDGGPLLRRVLRDHSAAHQATIHALSRVLEDSATFEAFGREQFGGLAPLVLSQPNATALLRSIVEAKLETARSSEPPPPDEVWALAPDLEGIQHAQLVVLNVRSANERVAAEAILDEIPRLRKDDAVHRAVIGLLGDRRPIMAVVADLSDPRDPGVKKAIVRVRRVPG